MLAVTSSITRNIKQEPVDSEPPDSATDTMDESMTKIGEEILPVVEVPTAPAIKFLTVKEDNNLEHTINSDIKQKPTADMELIKGAGPWEVPLQQLPTYTHSDIKQEPTDNDKTDPDDVTTHFIPERSEQHELQDIKYVTVKEDNNLEHTINSDIKQKPTADMELIKGAGPWEVPLQQLPTYTHSDIKQEPTYNDKTDPDDVTTQFIPEGSEQHELQDIKYVNTQDYLDIGKTMIIEQDRSTPGPSSKGDVTLKTKSNKNKTTRLLAGRKLFECDICGYQSRHRSHFNQHMRTHTGEKPYKCEVCDYKSRNKSCLTRHINRRHTGVKPHICKICDYKCIEKRDLTRHMRTHAGEKPYKCAICDYWGIQQSHLKRHMKTHTEEEPSAEKPYKCEVCDYKSENQRFLMRHINRKHIGVKQYTCDICDYKCIEKHDLTRHMRTHTGKKPYKCEICGFRGVQQCHLKRHMKTHTGDKPYKCEVCDYQCRELCNLKKHMRRCTGEKPFKCHICGFQSRYRSNLNKHMRMHTEKKPLNEIFVATDAPTKLP